MTASVCCLTLRLRPLTRGEPKQEKQPKNEKEKPTRVLSAVLKQLRLKSENRQLAVALDNGTLTHHCAGSGSGGGGGLEVTAAVCVRHLPAKRGWDCVVLRGEDTL